MPGVDTGPVEHRDQSLEVRLTLAQPRHLTSRERLVEAMRRDRRGEGEDFRHGFVRLGARRRSAVPQSKADAGWQGGSRFQFCGVYAR
jgi:hypothetical protein